MRRWKSALILLLTLALLLPMAANAAQEEGPFADVPADAWYAGAVSYVRGRGLMQGTGENAFSPETPFTRAQLVTILWRLAAQPTVNYAIPYPDVAEDAWYADAVRWAAAEKLLARADAFFGPGDILDRDETAALLWNLAKYLGMDVSVGEDTNILSYLDFTDITNAYIPAMQWAVGSGVLRGTDTALLSPRGQLTRAQAAMLLQRFCQLGDPLSLWTDGAPAKDAMLAYMEAVTDPESPDYIPPEDRIAVFDFDGTLFCETDPNYFDYTLLVYRVLEDPAYKDKASDFEKEVAGKIREQNATGKSFTGLETDHGKAVASAFAGMTLPEFNDYIQAFKRQPMPSYDGMDRGGGFYLPMVQMVEYLQDNGFLVYVISGTDRLIVRGIMDGNVLDIPNRQIIGSDESIVARGQGSTNGLDYFYTPEDELILGGDFLIKNLKMNKVSVIMQEIGQQPVLCFGNSTGDSSMAEYVITNNPYRSLSCLLCCDDLVRENGNLSKAQKMYDLCAEYGWIPVSMKNDWTTIYGDGVTYLAGGGALRPAA